MAKPPKSKDLETSFEPDRMQTGVTTPKGTATLHDDGSRGRDEEPVFELDLDGATGELKLEKLDPKVGAQINSLKNQIEKISDLPRSEELNTEQAQLLRKYIALKEVEVRDLQDQVKQYQNHLKKISAHAEKLTTRNRELLSEFETLRKKEESARAEKLQSDERLSQQAEYLKNQYEERLRQGHQVAAEADGLRIEKEEWRNKIKEDLKKIRLKERELENKYELLKRDMQALLDSKDKHVLELKKKNDALELEQETLEDRLRQASGSLNAVDARKRRLIETLRLALALLEGMERGDGDGGDPERKAG